MGLSAGENRGEMVMVAGCAVEAGALMLLVMIVMLRAWWRCWRWGRVSLMMVVILVMRVT